MSRRPYTTRGAGVAFLLDKDYEPDACRVWPFGLTHSGYGRTGHGERLAHRAAWIIAYGPIPEGMHVLHHCDNPPCVNPRHLFLGTNADNIADCVAKRRHAIGERHPASKLTEAQVAQIRSSAGTCNEVGRRFGVSGSQVFRIRNCQNWRAPSTNHR